MLGTRDRVNSAALALIFAGLWLSSKPLVRRLQERAKHAASTFCLLQMRSFVEGMLQMPPRFYPDTRFWVGFLLGAAVTGCCLQILFAAGDQPCGGHAADAAVLYPCHLVLSALLARRYSDMLLLAFLFAAGYQPGRGHAADAAALHS
jgi:hypothetical protein